MKIRFRDIQNEALEPISYYMKTFDHTYPGMGMHQHPYFEIMYASSGSFFLDIYDEKRKPALKRYTIHKGQIIILDAFVFHRILLDENKDAVIYNVEFMPRSQEQYNPFGVHSIISLNYANVFNNTNFKYVTNNPLGYVVATDTHQVGRSFKNLIILLSNEIKSVENACAVFSAQLSLFIEISKCLSLNSTQSVHYIRKTIAYIQENFNRSFSIDDIVAHVGISKAYLQRQFKQQTGTTILEAINNLRVQKAAELLVTTNMMIKDIATQVGFSSKNQMLYEFKRVFKITPLEYKHLNNKSTIDHHYVQYTSYALPMFDRPEFHYNDPSNDVKN
ncbi:MAG: helix-turn-helix domain-containing protein [Clostridia bacterium]|nr:helix-turn-helix domain-containing protein [Clostridia bacterium]